ncbi:hypothetical protein V6N12_065375 [Hibiscus sabdariffa]|uniref:Uncharacterized protein n=1 Tax=Hibiscus sabdariffa TaxID=183260 RepID=A0ABR2G8H8_9ROSI
MANNTISLRSLLEKEKLNGINFLDWFRNLRIVLKQERKEYVIEEVVPNDPGPNASRADKDKFKKHMDDMVDVGCLMLATMTPELQKQHENMVAYEMIQNLKEIYEGQARQERYETSKALFQCKMSEGSSVGAHVIKMMGYIQTLEKLGFALNDELATDVILQSLPDSFNQFVLNFNMNEINKTLPQLLGMLRTAESNMKKGGSKSVLMVRVAKEKGKKVAKSKGSGKTKPKGKEALKPKGGVSKDGKCFHCGKTGHWKRNCPIYLEDVKKAKAVGASVSGIYVIDVHVSTSSSWVLDTGCGSHICTSVQGLHTRRNLAKGDVDLRVGNGARVAALAVGTYVLSLPSGLNLNLENCYFVPSLTKNIISVSCLDKIRFEIIIKNNSCSFFYDNLFYGSAQLINGLYILNQENMIFNINTKKLKTNDSNQTYLWHCRLGHISERRISKLHKDGLLDPFVFEQLDVCESCLLGKMTKAPFSGKGERASDLLGLIHSDVCGPMNTQARGGYQYFITLTDDFSRYGYIYLMRHKSEALERFKEFKNEVQNQHGKSIKALRSDRGGEYLSQDFDELLKECGIVSQLTPPGTPQWNGVSERRNRTLLDMVRSMMSHTDLPTSFWGYALETTAFTLNRVPSKSVQKTPHEMWTGRRPNMSFMKIWGCKAYVKHQMSTKLEPISEKCTFVGYPKETKGYYFYNENKVFVARTGVFLEKEFLTNSGKGRNIELEEVQQQQVIEPEVERISQAVEENPTDLETQPLRRSTRERHEPERYGFLVTTHGDVILVDQDEPKTYQEAVAGPDSEKWLEAMRSEMDSMSENQVWTLVEPPEGIKPIGCKWVFKKKTDMDGNVQTYKGRLVAKGFRQIHGVDYDETFSPVAMIKSIRILLAVAAFHDYEIWQMDVKTAFLNGKLEEDVYMTQPEGFVTPEDARKVCKLQRSIYGLKQASRSWNLRFNEAIQEFGFIRNEDEPCVYKKFSGSIVSFLVLYVDDILIIGNDIPTLQSIKTWLSSCFSMKDLGEAAYILGVKIYRDRSRRLLGLSQSTYIDKVLKRFSMEESKRGFLPMRHGISLSKEMCPSTPQERERMSQIPYASAIGSIMYAMICTRLDLSYALSMTSRYQANPGEGHWTAVKNILKYLRRTKDVFLVYGGEEELRIKGAVSWKSSKQDTVADSTTEAEYIAASEAAKEAVWIKKFITELGVIPSISDAVDLYCDNNGAIAQAKEPRSHQRSKHILRRFHLIREIIDRGDVDICKVNTDDNIADPLTKPLAQQKHDRHTESLGIRYVSDWS